MPLPDSLLAPAPETIRAMGEATLALVADYWDGLDDRPVAPETTSAALRAVLDAPLPRAGGDFEETLACVRDVILAGSRHNAHRRMFGYVSSPGTPVAAFADLIASALNANVTAWRSAPAPAEVERLTVRWIGEILGFPVAEGLFVSGGSMANLCGLAAARDAVAPGFTDTGAAGPPLRVYASEEAHFSVHKAAGLLGLGRANVRAIPVDDHFRMDVPALVRAVEDDRAAGLRPCCVVASAGTVGTGAVDPTAEIRAVADRYGLWMHVDASYGGFAVLAPSARPLFRGLERADSVALDPHKWLYLPLDCGCVLYRDGATARAAFAHGAEYTRVLGHDADEAFAFWDYGPELSRRFRALKVWMTLRLVGTDALGAAVAHNLACARHLAARVEAADDFEMLAPVPLSIFCFRHVPPALRGDEAALDAHNERLLVALQRGGSSYLSNARVHGRFALRGCVLGVRTTEADMDRLLDDCRRAAEVT
jgi:aromatic-L-amino-acid/L-tryptophan decarboxylase